MNQVFPSVLFWLAAMFPFVLPAQVSYQDLKPIFDERCIICHNGPNAPKKLQLTSYPNIMKGSENGAVVQPGDPQASEIIRRLTGISQPRMPLTGPPYLTDEQIEMFREWIRAGAPEGPSPAVGTEAPIAQLPSGAETPPAAAASQRQPFLTYADVEPIFKMNCLKCHNTRGIMGPPPEGFMVGSYEALLATGDRARIVPGHSAASELVRRIRGQALPRMPFDGPPYLSEEQINLIVQWIDQGARSSDGTPAPLPVGAKVRLHGRLSSADKLDGLPLQIGSGTRLKKSPSPGDYVEVRGTVGEKGEILVERLRRR